jgi:hypothetical protein
MTIDLTRISSWACLAFCCAPLASQAAPNSGIEARIASCDLAISRAAAQEILHDPKALREPITLFQAALAQRMAEQKEEAAFLFLAGQLRTSRQVIFEKGDRPQLLAIMIMTVGPLTMPVLETDPELARRVVRRTIDWDRSTPDPSRDRIEAKSGENAKKIAEIDAGLARLPDQLQANAARVAMARNDNEMVKAMRAERCGD